MQCQLANSYQCVGGACFFHLGLLDPEDGGTVRLVSFRLFVHLFSHICNIGHVNYRLQFTTHLVIY